MSVFWQTVLAIFAAVGLYCTLHAGYELLFRHSLRHKGNAELTLYGDGCDASAEQLIATALHMRRRYLPGLAITFVEIGNGQGQNVAKRLAVRQDIMYLE